jgi:hypothetical protein
VGLSSSWPWPDKSGTHALEAGESFWKLVISLDKSSEQLEKDFWMVNHLNLSQNFFNALLLRVRLSYDSNKI